MPVRWITATDRAPLLHLMREAKMGSDWFDYADMDGQALVDEQDGELIGYALFTLAKPETHIRQLVVHPDHQHQGLVARRLLYALARVALTYGSQGIEGFVNTSEMEDMLSRVGAILQPGTRVRWPLVATAQAKAKKWQEEMVH